MKRHTDPNYLDKFEVRPHKEMRGSMQHGRSTTWIICPFCEYEVEAYNWSLAGSGKKCPICGAIHTLYYGTVKKKGKGKPK